MAPRKKPDWWLRKHARMQALVGAAKDAHDQSANERFHHQETQKEESQHER